ncbi:MAG: sugar phosphate isomerase/epimerase [Oscillospiraceae bacterium]|nr:sugar phosphate isomerase/epimerase [Oscillospiraceae bacterium]MDD3833144.1 sugar phosphate isomerase/epimerase [Oscillospiraceae bacterium]MDD4414238.1 sugar phosphate isomerase/epimerase [Oscillospiraceae bacterium]
MEIGAQLYTVREYTKTLDDFAKTLEKIRDIGYRVVQVSGTCSYEPEWLKNQLDRLGLTCAITHYNVDRIANETDMVVAEHKQFDCKYIGISRMKKGLKNGMEDYNAFYEAYKPAGKRIAELGCKLMYHNHAMEFAHCGQEKTTYLERMAADFEPNELGFILDTFWVQAGGGNPAQWIQKLTGRVPCIHLKDMTYRDGQQLMAPIYEGNMDFDSILEACETSGNQYLIVEQDDCYGEDPFECLKTSYNNLKSKGL